ASLPAEDLADQRRRLAGAHLGEVEHLAGVLVAPRVVLEQVADGLDPERLGQPGPGLRADAGQHVDTVVDSDHRVAHSTPTQNSAGRWPASTSSTSASVSRRRTATA